ncbi:Sister chromatid cohesion protein PDS5 homolog C [Linum perenne]
MADLHQQFKDVALLLRSAFSSSLDNLLTLLQLIEKLLMKVEQRTSASMKEVLIPVMEALIISKFSRHSSVDVRVSIASCYTQFTRITAPDAPYDNKGMKELFKVTVEAFQYLSDSSSPYYTKAVSILNTVAKISSCLVMLDLGSDQLILDMFQCFLQIDRSNHSPDALLAMETIMTQVINENEDVSLAILSLLLASLRNDNQTISPDARKLGEKVMTNCAAKLKTALKETVHSLGIALDDYASVVADICQDRSHPIEHNHLNDSQNCSEINLETGKPTLPKKRGRKPKSLMKLEESYDDPKVQTEGEPIMLRKRKPRSKRLSDILSADRVFHKSVVLAYQASGMEEKTVNGSHRKRGRSRKNGTEDSDPIFAAIVNDKVLSSHLKDTTDANSLAELLVGKKIRVYWPCDKVYYAGVVDSYDPTSKRHRILYADGEEERLNLRRERWELLEDDDDGGGGELRPQKDACSETAKTIAHDNIEELVDSSQHGKTSCTIESKENVPSTEDGSCREQTA